AGIAHGIDQVFDGAGRASSREIGTKTAAFAIDHVAGGTNGVAVEQLLAARGVAGQFRRRLFLDAAEGGDDLPDLLLRHANALLGCAVRRHRGTGNTVVDGAEEVGIGAAMFLLGACKVGTAAASARAESMAERAVRSELILAQLCHLLSHL